MNIVENVGYAVNMDDRSLTDFKPRGQIHLLTVGCWILICSYICFTPVNCNLSSAVGTFYSREINVSFGMGIMSGVFFPVGFS